MAKSLETGSSGGDEERDDLELREITTANIDPKGVDIVAENELVAQLRAQRGPDGQARE